MSASVTETIELSAPATAAAATPQKPASEDGGLYLRAEGLSVSEQVALKKGTTAIIFASITGVTGISSLLSGLVTVILPTMAKDLDISKSLLLWYFLPRLSKTDSLVLS
jgi:hypothetical protein